MAAKRGRKITDDKQVTEPEWKALPHDEYERTAPRLVHFSMKTVDSNASAGGIRLSPESQLDLPYVSARTMLAENKYPDVDYPANAGKTATVVKQIRMVLEGSTAEIPENDAEAIRAIMEKTRSSCSEIGTDHVDCHLRQILVPNDTVDGGYVALTPLTAAGVCRALNRAVTMHNDGIDVDNGKRRIQRARLGIGGSNPQNVGSLVREMQRPIIVNAPKEKNRLRNALRIYYRGPDVDFRRGRLRHSLDIYAEFRDMTRVNGGVVTTMEAREQEEILLRQIGQEVLRVGHDAFAALSAHAVDLPRENGLPGFNDAFEMISRRVPGPLRGLVDARLREFDYTEAVPVAPRRMNWPREMAQLVVARMDSVTSLIDGSEVHVLPLDVSAKTSVASILERVFR